VPADAVKTRFAPSPTGYIHLGNARTALFNLLLARREGGVFLLRMEDTDIERSREEFIHAIQMDLRWLGLEWQEGEGVGGAHGPYRQSQRNALYERYYAQLEQAGLAYPCFCSPEELAVSRKARLNAGQPPRYSGKCARLEEHERQLLLEKGLKPTLRFRVPGGRTIEFEDLVRGIQRYKSDEVGDFIIRRADGTPAFFFANAIDDSLMGVTHVLRGEDHLANTPRQLLLLEALRLPAPRYGHISLITGGDDSPLSKRHGSLSVASLREAGFLPGAIVNFLARMGHYYGHDHFLDLSRLAEQFELDRLSRAPAAYDDARLLYWQKEAVGHAQSDELWSWAGPEVHSIVPEGEAESFVSAVRQNVLMPDDMLAWARIIYQDDIELDSKGLSVVQGAGGDFFRHALEALVLHGTDFRALAAEVGKRSEVKGKALFMPLRVALTGREEGPEMAKLLPLLGTERARRRLEKWVNTR